MVLSLVDDPVGRGGVVVAAAVVAVVVRRGVGLVVTAGGRELAGTEEGLAEPLAATRAVL